MAEELSRSGSPVAGVDSSVDMGSSPKVRQSSNGFTKAKDGAAASTDDRGAMLLFGYDISGLNKTAQVIVLALGGIACALVFASLQEKVFVDKELKKHGGYIALLQTLTYMVCGFVEMRLMGDSRKGSLKDYAIVSLMTQAGMLCTNWSLAYLTYPTRVIFKSSKVIPVMFFGVLIMKRTYSVPQWLNAAVLCGGIAVFTLGDKSPDFDFVGIILITLSVGADALTSNFQEFAFFKTLKCSQAEVLAFGSAFGAASGGALLAITGELSAGVEAAAGHTDMYGYIVISSIMGYASVMFVLLLIKHFSATTAEVVKSCRKVLSIVLSFVFFARPINRNHIIGFALFLASILGGVYLKRRKDAAKANAQP